MPPRARSVRKKNAVKVTLDHGNGSRVMRFRLPGWCFCFNFGAYTKYYLGVTTPSQATSSQASDVLVGTTTSPLFEEPSAPDDSATSSAATVRATAAVEPSHTPHPLPPSVHAFRPASPENEFPNLLNFIGDEDEDEFVSETDERAPTTPCHPGINRAPLCPPSAQSRNPVTPARRLVQTPARPHTSRRRTRYRDGPAGNKKCHAAKDVWEFFVVNGNNRRECVLCQ